MKKLGILGAGGFGKIIADTAKNYYDEIVFFDDTGKEECWGYKVVGTTDDALNQCNKMDFFCSIGNTLAREKFITLLEERGANIPTLIHPSAIISHDAEIGKGTIVTAGAIIQPCVKIGKGAIINTCTSIDHDCTVGDFSHISVGVRVAGNVKIGNRVWVGVGATIINAIELCDDCFIGAGAVVVKSITEKGTYIGVPAKLKESK